ncbi:sugar dehydrogenase complex small subunit [Cribrihabitans neustonicus]|uniref:sugar dehydrogenase complex small subunit n=1 Tax=Cribrihabitans neustonicus TaxID=1429085 RepID=UPI003B5BAF9E
MNSEVQKARGGTFFPFRSFVSCTGRISRSGALPEDTVMDILSSRRAFLAGSSAAAFSAAAGWPIDARAAALTAGDFLKISQDLTGRSGLDEDIAAAMLAAFKASGHEAELAELGSDQPDPALQNSIVAAWYSGVSPDPDAETVLTYTEALMWEAMSYTKPMGYCGGPVGYWAEPPAS